MAPRESSRQSDLVSALQGAVPDPSSTVEMASWLGLLTRDHELSEYGLALQWLAGSQTTDLPNGPFPVGATELLLWLLLRVDHLLLALLKGWDSSTTRPDQRVEQALGALLSDLRQVADPDNLAPAPRLADLLASSAADPGRGDELLRARLDLLASLGLLLPGGETRFSTSVDSRLRGLIDTLQQVSLTADGVQAFLDGGFFSAVLIGPARHHSAESTSRIERLLWLSQAYAALQRPLGFTPGRPISLLACCLALRAGVALEIEDAYECIYGAAEDRWSEYLHFSGGSRFDREFLIRIDPGLAEELEREITAGSSDE